MTQCTSRLYDLQQCELPEGHSGMHCHGNIKWKSPTKQDNATAVSQCIVGLVEYQRSAAKTLQLLSDKDSRLHTVLGLVGEVGEFVELIKKDIYHGREASNSRLEDELGDILWYVAAIATVHGFSLSTIANNNIAKLQRRYPNGFQKGPGEDRVD